VLWAYPRNVPPTALTPVIRICNGCDERLSEASKAIRHHAALMNDAIVFIQSGANEKQLKEFREKLVTSFNDAQEAWDAYREHLNGHGLLPAPPSPRDVA
jgi:hypothetical protein